MFWQHRMIEHLSKIQRGLFSCRCLLLSWAIFLATVLTAGCQSRLGDQRTVSGARRLRCLRYGYGPLWRRPRACVQNEPREIAASHTREKCASFAATALTLGFSWHSFSFC